MSFSLKLIYKKFSDVCYQNSKKWKWLFYFLHRFRVAMVAMSCRSGAAFARDALPVAQGLLHAVARVGVAVTEGLGQACFHGLRGWRRTCGFELIDQQHHGLKVLRIERQFQHALAVGRGVGHVGSVGNHVPDQARFAMLAGPVQWDQAAGSGLAEVGADSEDFGGSRPAGGLDHLLCLPIAHGKCSWVGCGGEDGG